MKNKEIIAIITKSILDEIFTLFIKYFNDNNIKYGKGISELVFIIRSIKKRLENENFGDNSQINIDIINKITHNTLDYYKNNIELFVNKFLVTKKKYKIVCDSISASLTIKLFTSIKDTCFVHVFNSKLGKFDLSNYNKNTICNINNNRLSETPELAYPENDRPRGDRDLESVNYHRNKLKNGEELEPIWIIEKNGKKYILDGFHRLASSYIEQKSYINAYYIKC
jgi:hypothetical protein